MTPTSRSERRRNRQRQRLIDAARQIIARKGLSGLTVQDVTEEADMAVGSFYTYFPSKEALLEAAIWEDLQRLGNPDNPLVQGMAPEARRQMQLFQTFKFVEEHRDLMSAVFGPGGSIEQYERALTLIEKRTEEGLRFSTDLPDEAIRWITPLLAGLLAGGIRYLLAHPEATAEEMTLRTMSLLRPMTEQIAPANAEEDA